MCLNDVLVYAHTPVCTEAGLARASLNFPRMTYGSRAVHRASSNLDARNAVVPPQVSHYGCHICVHSRLQGNLIISQQLSSCCSCVKSVFVSIPTSY